MHYCKTLTHGIVMSQREQVRDRSPRSVASTASMWTVQQSSIMRQKPSVLAGGCKQRAKYVIFCNVQDNIFLMINQAKLLRLSLR